MTVYLQNLTLANTKRFITNPDNIKTAVAGASLGALSYATICILTGVSLGALALTGFVIVGAVAALAVRHFLFKPHQQVAAPDLPPDQLTLDAIAALQAQNAQDAAVHGNNQANAQEEQEDDDLAAALAASMLLQAPLQAQEPYDEEAALQAAILASLHPLGDDVTDAATQASDLGNVEDVDDLGDDFVVTGFDRLLVAFLTKNGQNLTVGKFVMEHNESGVLTPKRGKVELAHYEETWDAIKWNTLFVDFCAQANKELDEADFLSAWKVARNHIHEVFDFIAFQKETENYNANKEKYPGAFILHEINARIQGGKLLYSKNGPLSKESIQNEIQPKILAYLDLMIANLSTAA